MQRQFTATAPNRLWFTDLTMIRTGEGWLHAAVVLDAFNREVISWATDLKETPRTALTALREAIKIRRPKPGCVIHSDRGYQFTSHDWNDLAAQHQLTVSIGSTRAIGRAQLFGYIWAYNTRRLHSTLGYVAPIRYN